LRKDSVGVCRLDSGRPAIGQPLIELAQGGGGDAGEHVAEIGERLQPGAPGPLTGGDEGVEDGGRVPAVVGAAEEPVLSAESGAAQSVLGRIIVDGQVAVGRVSAKGLPLIERVGDGLAHRALGQHSRRAGTARGLL